MYHSNEKIQSWLVRIIGHEGEYWDDPVGGPTKWGISQKSYPHLDIKSIPVEYAAKIYRDDYIKPLGADMFEDGVAFQLLDFAVNSGQPNAVKALQKELKVYPDGKIGKNTMEAIMSYKESDLTQLIIASRISFMTKLKNWDENSRGWMNRVADNLRYSVQDT